MMMAAAVNSKKYAVAWQVVRAEYAAYYSRLLIFDNDDKAASVRNKT
jgi:hypothetical protein